MYINITIEGVAPILMNCFNGQVDPNETPEEQAAKKAYRNHDTEELELPCQNIMACLIEAGENFFSTDTASLVPTNIQVLGLAVPFGTKNFKVDSRSVVARSTGERIMCHRPCIEEWQLTFQIFINENILKQEEVRELIEHAGVAIGLGDYRPQCRGPFGRFIVKNWQEANAPQMLQKAA